MGQHIQSFRRNMRYIRSAHFVEFMSSFPQPIYILDVGGTEAFWKQTASWEKLASGKISITLLNMEHQETELPELAVQVGDARDLGLYKTNSFDVVFSNSVIEHVGGYEDQKRMAHEVMRVGKHYYIQTPNRNFPVEPHYFLPFFQFMPQTVQIWMLRIGYFSSSSNGFSYHRTKTTNDALLLSKRIRLLNRQELKALFPNGAIYQEKLLGLTKSFIIWGNSE